MKNRPTFDPWPGESPYVFHGHPRQPFNWARWMVVGILGAGVGISAIVWWTA